MAKGFLESVREDIQERECKRLREERNKLWDILDDIDTLDDSCRGSDSKFRINARKHVKRRFKVLESDGQVLYRAGESPESS